MADQASDNSKYVLQYLLSKLASLSSGLTPQGLSASAPQDIPLPNESGQVDPRLLTQQSPVNRAVSGFRALTSRK